MRADKLGVASFGQVELPKFSGRHQEREQIIRSLLESGGKNVVLVQGEHRIGKSSMIDSIRDELKVRADELRNLYGREFVVLPLRLSGHRTAASLLGEMLERISGELRERSIAAELTEVNGTDLTDTGAIRALKSLLDRMPGVVAVFVFDDVDY
jgi:hypothetical protein